jgi:hypothetical protein
MNIREMHNRDRELEKLNQTLRRTVRLCKTIWYERESIEQIKDCLSKEDLVGASQLWNELDYGVQKLLIIAPLFGGPFTTEERGIIKSFWIITVADIEGTQNAL